MTTTSRRTEEKQVELIPKDRGNKKKQPWQHQAVKSVSTDYDEEDDDDDNNNEEEKYAGDRSDGNKQENAEDLYSKKLIADENFRFTFYSFFYMIVCIPYLLIAIHDRIRDTNHTFETDDDLSNINIAYILTWFFLFLAASLTIVVPTNKCGTIIGGIFWLIGGLCALIACGLRADYACQDFEDREYLSCGCAYYGGEGIIIGVTAMVIAIDCFKKHGNNFKARIISYSVPVLLTTIALMIPLYELNQVWYLFDTTDTFKTGVLALFIASVLAMFVFAGFKKFVGPWYGNKFL
jgi:hypothetical protein